VAVRVVVVIVVAWGVGERLSIGGFQCDGERERECVCVCVCNSDG
jgi:hypothetical protein